MSATRRYDKVAHGGVKVTYRFVNLPTVVRKVPQECSSLTTGVLELHTGVLKTDTGVLKLPTGVFKLLTEVLKLLTGVLKLTLMHYNCSKDC